MMQINPPTQDNQKIWKMYYKYPSEVTGKLLGRRGFKGPNPREKKNQEDNSYLTPLYL